jgi:uncharacterized protein (UPF0276 family)
MPTIVEWDDELPPLSALVAEADQADAVATWAREAASADAG